MSCTITSSLRSSKTWQKAADPMGIKHIRDYYQVPAVRGTRVTVDGRPGVVTGATSGSSYIRVRFDGERRSRPCHPTWRVEYERRG